MIDTHCHIDMYQNPKEVILSAEKMGINIIGMTNLPSHFKLGLPHVKQFRRVRLALGLHPLLAKDHKKEIKQFHTLKDQTSYIGEVGLDFSKEGINTKQIQLDSFTEILEALKGTNKIFSLHSRKAEIEVLKYLKLYNIQNAIFHWYTGPISLVQEIVNSGYFLSINTAMIKSNSGKKIIEKIPLTNVLVESDGPYIMKGRVPVKPTDIVAVYEFLAKQYNKEVPSLVDKLNKNFTNMTKEL